MRWCSDKELAEILQLDRGYTVERLRRDDIPLVISSIQAWYPDISVGIGSVYLRHSFYEENVALDGVEYKDVAVWVFRYLGELVGMLSDERIPESLSLYGRLMVVSPQHRKAHIGGRIIASSAARARAQGAEYVYANATLKTQIVQLALERAGFQLVGFSPGADRELDATGSVKRVYEAVYALSLAPREGCLLPNPQNLSPRARALFELLFPDANGKNAA